MEQHDKILAVMHKFLVETADTNPYATAATMRALDGLIRNQLSAQLARAAHLWRETWMAYNRTIPPATREEPFPDRAMLQTARQLKGLADRLSSLAGTVTALPAPVNDRVWNRVRNHALTLQTLIDMDYDLVSIASGWDSMPTSGDSTTVTETTARLDQLESRLRDRQLLLERVP